MLFRSFFRKEPLPKYSSENSNDQSRHCLPCYVHVNSERISISRTVEVSKHGQIPQHLVHEATVLFVKLAALHVPIMSRVPLPKEFLSPRYAGCHLCARVKRLHSN